MAKAPNPFNSTNKAAEKAMARRAQKTGYSSGFSPKLVLIVLVLLGALFAGYKFMIKKYHERLAEFVRIDVLDTTLSKEVLFGGQPWMIYCNSDDSPGHKIPQNLLDACFENAGKIRCGMMHCDMPMESKKTIVQRFKLQRTFPIVFVAANGDGAKQVMPAYVHGKPDALAKHARDLVVPKVVNINTSQKWESHCVKRKSCVVVGHKGGIPLATRNILSQVMPQHRGVKVVAVDTKIFKVKLDDAMLATRGEKNAVDIMCLTNREGFRGAFMQGGADDSSAIRHFIQACGENSVAGSVALATPPEVSVKSKYASPEPTVERKSFRERQEEKLAKERESAFIDGWDDLLGDDDGPEEEEEEEAEEKTEDKEDL